MKKICPFSGMFFLLVAILSGNFLHAQIVRDYQISSYQSLFMSSPVTTHTIGDALPATPSEWVLEPVYNVHKFSPAAGWVEIDENEVMIPGKGYVVTTGGDTDYDNIDPEIMEYPQTYTGTANDGDVTIAVGGSGTYNLLGNPYPDFLDADSFLLDEDNEDVISGPIMLWSKNTIASDGVPGNSVYNFSSNDYALYNVLGGVSAGRAVTKDAFENLLYNMNIPNGKIYLGTAFFIRGNGSGGNVTFKNNMRTTTADVQMFRGNVNAASALISPPERHRIWVNLEQGPYVVDSPANSTPFRQALVGYADGATDSQDDRVFDAESAADANIKINVYSFAPASVTHDKHLSIQGLGLPFDVADYFQLGYKVTEAGDYTFTSIGDGMFDGTPGSMPYFLWDNGVLHTFPYTFTASANEASDTRFRVVFAPVYTQLNASFCDTSIPGIGTPINAGYVHPLTENYHWEITNMTTMQVGEIDTPTLQTSLADITDFTPDSPHPLDYFLTHGTTYSVRIKLTVAGYEYDYGPTCTITTEDLVIGNNQSIACEGVIPFTTQISCTTASPFNYHWEVTRADGEIREFDTSTNAFVFFSGGSPAEMQADNFMRYNTRYCIRVLVDYGNGILGEYSDACCYTTPTSGVISNNQSVACGGTLPVGSQISCTSLAPYNYHWEVTRTNPNGSYTVKEFDTGTSNVFYFFGASAPAVMNSDTFFRYGTTYCVRVRAFNSTFTGDYSIACCFVTPAYAGTITNNKSTACGGTFPATVNHQITATSAISGFGYTYDWLVERSDFVQRTLNTTSSSFLFKSSQTGLGGGFLLANTQYCLTVRIAYGDGTFSNPGPVCCYTTQNGALRQSGSTLFDATAAPNPFANNFNIQLESNSTEIVSLKVYDMLGRLIEQQELKESTMGDISFGGSYPAGVYNVVIAQGGNRKTLRVVKK